MDLLPDLVREARKRTLNDDEAQILAEALRRHEPWLEWAGKRERPWFAVDPVALHMHERVSTEAMLRAVRRKEVQRSLFGDLELDYAKAVQFYRHDVHWTNRLILGDSLQVMASLARREDLAGKVQMIYVDPPYGISFRSNFQPDLGRRDVKDREHDLTREPPDRCRGAVFQSCRSAKNCPIEPRMPLSTSSAILVALVTSVSNFWRRLAL